MTNKQLQAKLDEAMTAIANLTAAQASATKPAPQARPLVELTHMKALNPATGKWDIDDPEKPAVLVNFDSDKRGKKFSVDNFEALFVTRHAEILTAYAALKRN